MLTSKRLVATAALLVLAPLAQADELDWLITYTSTTPGISGSIIVNTSDTLTPSSSGGAYPAGYAIENISGTVDGAAITGLAPPPTFPPSPCCSYYFFDNSIIPGPGLDTPGIGLFTSDGLFHNIFYGGAGSSGTGPGFDGICAQTALDCAPGGFFNEPGITFTITTAPEPATLGLLALGLLGVGFTRRRRVA